MKLLYNLSIRSYYILILLFSIWNEKARQWVRGRKNWEERLKEKFSGKERVIWFHCSSLGEFEQGRTVIETISRHSNEKKILLTFYSPSGYEKRKDYESVDYVTYLPLDTKRNARRFLRAVPVEYAVFIKYEFWFYILKELYQKGIPVYLISGLFRKNHLFFKWYGAWYRSILGYFTHLFVQDANSISYLEKFGYSDITLAGDTRFDRVSDIANSSKKYEIFGSGKEGRKILIAGSTWPHDEKIIMQLYRELESSISLVIAPHEPTQKNIRQLQELFPRNILFTEIEERTIHPDTVVIINTIGHLSSLYRYGDFAYIGGGFNKGIHNILEATAAFLPVIIGPKYEKFIEAKDLVKEGGALPVSNSDEAIAAAHLLVNTPGELDKRAKSAGTYTKNKKGATKIITDYLLHRFHG